MAPEQGHYEWTPCLPDPHRVERPFHHDHADTQLQTCPVPVEQQVRLGQASGKLPLAESASFVRGHTPARVPQWLALGVVQPYTDAAIEEPRERPPARLEEPSCLCSDAVGAEERVLGLKPQAPGVR